MSWLYITVPIFLVALVCAYGLGEWLARRLSGRADDDRGPSAG